MFFFMPKSLTKRRLYRVYLKVVNDNEKNYYSKEGSSFLALNNPAIVDGENYNVEIKIKKTPTENKFYIHNMTLKNKNETVSLNAKDKKSRGYNSYDLSRTDNIANNASNVNKKSAAIIEHCRHKSSTGSSKSPKVSTPSTDHKIFIAKKITYVNKKIHCRSRLSLA